MTVETQVSAKEVVEQLLSDICYLSHKHEVQYWLDAPGTPDEKLRQVLFLARKALAVVTGKLSPEDA